MYKKPETDTTPVKPMSIICVSPDGRVGVDNDNVVTGKDLF